MGYLHIDNLYKNQTMLLFKECYALEKVHGTSAHVGWKGGNVTFHSGGVSNPAFVALFDKDALAAALANIGEDVTLYGEAYGGSCQKMSDTYGKELRFVAFDVRCGEHWLVVPAAHDVATKCGLEFVHYEKGPCELEWLNGQRDADSTQAIRNGVGPGKMREGVVLRPLVEVTLNNGQRVIAKHKRDEFKETATPREVEPGQLEVLQAAEAIAMEWVTAMRLAHVVDKLGAKGVEDTGKVIKAMMEDVEREAAGEVVMSKDARKAIGGRAAKLWKEQCQRVVS